MNKLQIVGFIGTDIKTGKTKTKNSMCRFTVSVKRKYKKGAMDYFNCIAFGKIAEQIYKNFERGRQIGLSGWIGTYLAEHEGKKFLVCTFIVEEWFGISNLRITEDSFYGEYRKEDLDEIL